jgi:tetratricopeptide (TPR) repeat protein
LLAKQLRETEGSLDAFAAVEPAIDVRSVFSWSYRTLSPHAARLFRYLSLHPGATFGERAAASLAGVPMRQERQLLAELTHAHLLTEAAPGRYSFHDLLRAYATEKHNAHEQDTGGEGGSAIRRLLHYYLHSAHAANLICHPLRPLVPLSAPGAEITVEEFTEPAKAFAWYGLERPALRSCVDIAVGLGLVDTAWQLIDVVTGFFENEGHWDDQLALQAVAMQVALQRGDRFWQARTLRSTFIVYGRLGRQDEHRGLLLAALEIFKELGDRHWEGRIYKDLSLIASKRGDHDDAMQLLTQAQDIFETIGDSRQLAYTLNNFGCRYAQLGDYPRALAHCQEALEMHETLGDLYGVGETCDSIGYIQHRSGHHTDAVASYRRSLDYRRRVGDRHGEANTSDRLGDTYKAMGDHEAARSAWQSAFDILSDLHHPDADTVHAKLRDAGDF